VLRIKVLAWKIINTPPLSNYIIKNSIFIIIFLGKMSHPEQGTALQSIRGQVYEAVFSGNTM
jgi:hypothetical protein